MIVSPLYVICMLYLFFLVPIYSMLNIAALITRQREARHGSGNWSGRVRSFANLLPIISVFALFAVDFASDHLARPLIHAGNGDLGSRIERYTIWTGILSVPLLAVILTACLTRFATPLKIMSSFWWAAFYATLALFSLRVVFG